MCASLFLHPPVFVVDIYDTESISMSVCTVITSSRVWINRVRLPVLLVVN